MRTTTIFLTAALILASFIGISCRKEMSEPASETPVTVIGTINDDNATKVSLSEGTGVIKTAWDAGDKIIGWDEGGNELELEIESSDRITSDGTAIFTLVNGTLPTTEGAKIKMIYAPDKTVSDLTDDGLVYNLSSQSADIVPALMTATGTLTDGQINLAFSPVLALVAVKNPTLQASSFVGVTGLELSGSNVYTSVTISKDLALTSSGSGAIDKGCNFATESDGTTSDVMVYFAVAPNSTAATVTVSTAGPTGYEIIRESASFTAGNCYLLGNKTATKKVFTISAPGSITGGTITTDPSGSAAWDTEVTVTPAPLDGYELDGSIAVTGTSGSSITVNSNKFTMPQEDVTVSGSFRLKDFTIMPTGTGSGTYVVDGGTYTIKRGTADVTTAKMDDVITVTPSSPTTGYSGGTVTVKKTDTNEPVDFDTSNKTFTMPAADVTITVSFTHDEYSITKAPAANGSFTVKKSGNVVEKAYYNNLITVEVSPAFGYELVSIKWKKNSSTGTGTDITSGKTFNMPAEDVTVTVTFRKVAFSVASGKRVWFAPGNLYAKRSNSSASDWTWGFYEKQYQFNSLTMPQIFNDGGYRNASQEDTEIDLFTWGYSGSYSTDPITVEYISGNNNLTSAQDWGSIPGLPSPPGATWHTLSQNEWSYLLFDRTTNCKFGSTTNTTARWLKCKVKDVTVQGGKKDVSGLLIFPDTFTWPTTVTTPNASYINKEDLEWNSVPVYTVDQFAALEGAGVVFLPTAGGRFVTAHQSSGMGKGGSYWSSTAVVGGSDAYEVMFNVGIISTTIYGHRNEGSSVRLVSSVQ